MTSVSCRIRRTSATLDDVTDISDLPSAILGLLRVRRRVDRLLLRLRSQVPETFDSLASSVNDDMDPPPRGNTATRELAEELLRAIGPSPAKVSQLGLISLKVWQVVAAVAAAEALVGSAPRNPDKAVVAILQPLVSEYAEPLEALFAEHTGAITQLTSLLLTTGADAESFARNEKAIRRAAVAVLRKRRALPGSPGGKSATKRSATWQKEVSDALRIASLPVDESIRRL
jgi:hypothetical protein